MSENNNISQEIIQAYNDFISKIRDIKGNPIQLQQAYIRFDEGHMWLQQACINYKDMTIDTNKTEQKPELADNGAVMD